MGLRTWMAASVVAMVTGAIGTGGCSGGSPGDSIRNEAVGTVAAALSAVGPDGATYTLNGAYLSLVPTGSTGQVGSLFFNGTTPTQSFSLATGSYAATLNGGPIDGAPGWTLGRTADGGASSVSAVLLDAQPYALAIQQGATTNLALHFEVANVGTIVFSAGTVTTSLQVDAGLFPPGHASFTGSGLFIEPPFSTGNALLDQVLDTPAAGVTVPYTVSVTLTSPFQMMVDQVCASITASVTATAAPDAGAEDDYASWFEETDGGTGIFCISDATGSSSNSAWIIVNRSGAPKTTPFQNALGATSSDEQFQLLINVHTPSPYLVNGVLSLAALSQPTTLTLNQSQLSVSTASAYGAASITGLAQVTLQVTP